MPKLAVNNLSFAADRIELELPEVHPASLETFAARERKIDWAGLFDKLLPIVLPLVVNAFKTDAPEPVPLKRTRKRRK